MADGNRMVFALCKSGQSSKLSAFFLTIRGSEA